MLDRILVSQLEVTPMGEYLLQVERGAGGVSMLVSIQAGPDADMKTVVVPDAAKFLRPIQDWIIAQRGPYLFQRVKAENGFNTLKGYVADQRWLGGSNLITIELDGTMTGVEIDVEDFEITELPHA